MWIMVFIVLLDLRGFDKVIVLESYPTEDACVKELHRVQHEMDKTYPNDQTYRLECRLRGQRI